MTKLKKTEHEKNVESAVGKVFQHYVANKDNNGNVTGISLIFEGGHQIGIFPHYKYEDNEEVSFLEIDKLTTNQAYEVHSRVSHEKYGQGIIAQVTEEEDGIYLSILFDRDAFRKIKASDITVIKKDRD